MWTCCGDVSKIVREVTETREFLNMSLLQPYLHGHHRQIEKYPKIKFWVPLHCNSYNMYKVIITRPAGPMAIQLWTKNIKNLEIASYALCFCPNFKPFRSISYSFKDKDILHTNWVSSKFLTQDLEILSLNYQKAHLISIGNNVWKSYTLCWQRYALNKIMRCPPAHWRP